MHAPGTGASRELQTGHRVSFGLKTVTNKTKKEGQQAAEVAAEDGSPIDKMAEEVRVRCGSHAYIVSRN